jgi:hypothetical protein
MKTFKEFLAEQTELLNEIGGINEFPSINKASLEYKFLKTEGEEAIQKYKKGQIFDFKPGDHVIVDGKRGIVMNVPRQFGSTLTVRVAELDTSSTIPKDIQVKAEYPMVYPSKWHSKLADFEPVVDYKEKFKKAEKMGNQKMLPKAMQTNK